MNAEKEVRIIVKNDDQVGKIIKWYQDNKQMLDAEKFVIPFQSGSIILPGEIVSFEARKMGRCSPAYSVRICFPAGNCRLE